MAINIRVIDKVLVGLLVLLLILVGYIISKDKGFGASPKQSVSVEQFVEKSTFLNCKEYISTLKINGEPISLFLNNYGQIGTVRYNMTEVKKNGWEFNVNYVMLRNDLNNGLNGTWNYSYGLGSKSIILFGAIPYRYGEIVKVNNLSPKYFIATIDNKKYLLWYLESETIKGALNVSLSN